jgi:hypothetical protein
MNVKASMMSGLARQLGQPQGVGGRVIGVMLNRANRSAVIEAVKACLRLPVTQSPIWALAEALA